MTERLRAAVGDDVSAILELAEAHLDDDQRYQATFWRRAGGSREQQATYLRSRLTGEGVVAYVHEAGDRVDGLIVANLVSAPPVYQPGGPVALIDDFAVRAPSDWTAVGRLLLQAATAEAREKGAVVTAVVAGQHADGKRRLLSRAGYSPASEWHLIGLDLASGEARDDQIRPADLADLPAIVELADQRRSTYQTFQPIFWRNAPDARERQRPFLERIVRTGSAIGLVHARQGQVDGFVIGSLIPSPAVFGSERATCLIDDFHVSVPDSWRDVGRALLQSANREARNRGAAQTAVICGRLDRPKRDTLEAAGLVVSSEWWLKPP
ncbi:MAG: hypothetical protein ACREOS_09140 [Candidatus Dormibacteraceae bacterium]